MMESAMLTIKFLALYGLLVFVVIVVGATMLAGLYQLIRDQVRGIADKARKDRALASVTVQKSS
jgi:hypothetical protein